MTCSSQTWGTEGKVRAGRFFAPQSGEVKLELQAGWLWVISSRPACTLKPGKRRASAPRPVWPDVHGRLPRGARRIPVGCTVPQVAIRGSDNRNTQCALHDRDFDSESHLQPAAHPSLLQSITQLSACKVQASDPGAQGERVRSCAAPFSDSRCQISQCHQVSTRTLAVLSAATH
jgi:hypothetical protein